jgi:spore maturation protein CgeB
VKLIYQGPLNAGSTSLQRLEAFARVPGIEVVPLDTKARFGTVGTFYQRARWKLRLPVDSRDENGALERLVAAEQPDVVFIDNSRVIQCSTLRRLRRLGARILVYYTSDDIIGTHNLSWPLRLTFPEWDVFFTTKTFNLPELAARGVRRPILIGKAFDPALHRPMTREEVGEDYERYDGVFIGTYEAARCRSINVLASSGFRVGVWGSGWRRHVLASEIELRPAIYGYDYTRIMHHGKIALCFLRKLNRDRITQRTMEIAAMGRPMLAEKTKEHDDHFVEGIEYISFASDQELADKARALLLDRDELRVMGARARARCLSSGYSTIARAAEMLRSIIGDEAPTIESNRPQARTSAGGR